MVRLSAFFSVSLVQRQPKFIIRDKWNAISQRHSASMRRGADTEITECQPVDGARKPVHCIRGHCSCNARLNPCAPRTHWGGTEMKRVWRRGEIRLAIVG